MGHVARLILVSREMSPEDLPLLRKRLPSEKDFVSFVTWDYDDNSVNSKWYEFEKSTMSLAAYLQDKEDR